MEMEVKYLVLESLEEIEKRVRVVYPEIEYVGELHLPAIYYDTQELKFEKEKMALRIRKENEKWIGCLKGATSQERIFIEEEVELSDEEKRKKDWFSQLENFPLIQEVVGQAEIKPLVKIDTRRKVYLLEKNGVKVEVALDWVDYLDGVAQEERLEVELKEGEFEQFSQMVQEFEEQILGLQETDCPKYKTAVGLLPKDA